MQTRGTVVAVPAPVCPCVSLSIWLPSFGLHNRLTCQATEREMHRQKTPPHTHTAGATLWRRRGGCAEDYADRPECTAEFHARHQTLEIISGLRAHRRLHCVIGLSLRGATILTGAINRKYFTCPRRSGSNGLKRCRSPLPSLRYSE